MGNKKCDHLNFKTNVKVSRLTEVEDGPVTNYIADIEIHCADCMKPFKFKGLPMGLSFNQPMVCPEGIQLRPPNRAY